MSAPFVYRFVGQVERVFTHLSHSDTTTVTVDGQQVEADPNQTVELHPGADVVLTTDTPQAHAELEPVNDAAIAAAAEQAAPVPPVPAPATDPTTQTDPAGTQTADPATETPSTDPQADTDPTTQNTTETS